MPDFTARIERFEGPGGWHYVVVPEPLIPEHAGAFGRTPVTLTLGAYTGATSVWRDPERGAVLPLSKKARGRLVEGDLVELGFELDLGR
ncbi:MAG: DUF1905 domain-containing protein [Alphaproteobacteria bacterium]|nr:DUF1905 domain-containing protein [Alphaproteobacteria bacterium]MCB9791559.1 DUF1905 domain-containing protein [Alphaproteobacteria bacterium]